MDTMQRKEKILVSGARFVEILIPTVLVLALRVLQRATAAPPTAPSWSFFGLEPYLSVYLKV